MDEQKGEAAAYWPKEEDIASKEESEAMNTYFHPHFDFFSLEPSDSYDPS